MTAIPEPAPSRGAAPVSARGVWKSFGSAVALSDAGLEARAGEIVAVLGPNGAGKTTMLSILLGLRRADRGVVRLFGEDPRRAAARVAVGATPQETAFPETLRVAEVIRLVRAHFPRPLATAELVERFALAGLERRQTGALSGGEKRRLAVALAFAGDPRVVFLDEPTTGLDVSARRRVWEAVRSSADAGRVVVLTTHYLDEAEALATRVVVLARGRVVAEGEAAEIRARTGLQRVRLRAGALPTLPGVVRSSCDCGVWQLDVEDGGAVVEALVRAGVALQRLEVGSLGLEEAFLRLTGEEE